MKKYLLYLVVVVSVITAIITSINNYKLTQYYNATESLLEEMDILCEEWDVPLGDTVCEGDNWCNYVDAKRMVL